MTNQNGQLSFQSIRRSSALNFLGAILLILLGIVFQLSELGYGHLRPENFWFLSMIATSLWNLFAAHSNAPGAGELLSFWPLLLICFGFAALLARSANCPASSAGAGGSYER